MNTTGWRIDPETLSLTNPDAPDRFAAAEFASQRWPPCPVCGATVEPEQIYITANEEDHRLNGDTYIPGLWSCPRGCNPLTGQRMHYSQESGQDANGRWFRCSCGVSEISLSWDDLAQLRDEHRIGTRP